MIWSCRTPFENIRMAFPSDEGASAQNLLSLYASGFWNRIRTSLPALYSTLLAKISNLHGQSSPNRHRKRKPGFSSASLSDSVKFNTALIESSEAFELLEDILEHVLSDLHNIQKSLNFWQSRAKGTNARKAYFMVFERGPRAFIDGTVQLIRYFATKGSPLQHLGYSSADSISERINALTRLQNILAKFLVQIYTELYRFGKAVTREPVHSLPSLLVTINSLFLKLEASGDLPQKNDKVHRTNDFSALEVESHGNTPILFFEKIPTALQEKSQWTDGEIRDAINLIYLNLQRLDSWSSYLVMRYQKPRRMTLFWLHYTCGAVGLSVCSLWLLRHSSLMGSSDIDNWINEAKESTVGFLKVHVEMPLLSIRDELFETFRSRREGVMELEEVQLTANSLHRMLKAFSEQTKGQKIPENASDLEMLTIVMDRYEEELLHPIQNLLGGELARALLIQVQKLKLDLETALLELNQILKTNEINFAVLAALPAFFLSIILVMLVRALFTLDKRAEGRGRIAREQRMRLIQEVGRRIAQFQTCMDQGLDDDAQCTFGLLLYSLDRIYKAVEKHAEETGEWPRLRQDLIDLGKPGVQTISRLAMISCIREYKCLHR